ncbi:hypothetical protein [Shewanella algae]|uniref:hypothetical protein n=1 Tax=Shewanella algae TaxID=38313 RepID=UPI0031F4BE98
MNEAYGTQANPIRRLQDNLKREKISLCKNICEEGLETAPDLNKLRGAADYSNDTYTFIFNIITNQQLTSNAIRVGCFLCIHQELNVDEFLFDLSNIGQKFSDKNLAGGYCDDFVHIITAKNTVPELYWMRFTNLLKLLDNVGIMLTRLEVIDALIELHEFYYITATDICYENSLKRYKKTGQVKKLSADTELVHIHLTTSMHKVALTKKWTSYAPNRY